MNWFYSGINYFSSDRRYMLLHYFTESQYRALPSDQQSALKYTFAHLGSMDPGSLDMVYEYLLRAATDKPGTYLFLAKQGSEYLVELHKEPDTDWSGYAIVARSAADNAPLSSLAYTGSSSLMEVVQLDGLSLESPGFYKVNINLEHVEEGQTSGEVISSLLSMYLFVSDNITISS